MDLECAERVKATTKEAEKNGELSSEQAQQQLKQLARYKPRDMAGNAIWSFAPAAAAYLNWNRSTLVVTAAGAWRSSPHSGQWAGCGDARICEQAAQRECARLRIGMLISANGRTKTL
jgi:hypothetical protein